MSKTLRIILVDDSKTILAQLGALCSHIDDVEIVGTAEDGAEAVKLITGLKPHLVLMDIVMPNMDGLSALRIISSAAPECRIAMISSVGGLNSRSEEAFRLGAFQVIGKPIDPEQIEELLVNELESLRQSEGV
jgi:YesN/AraC family two-component response regulator